MRPYLAIVKDSFREALASRTLWAMLVLTTLVLLTIAPLGFREELTTSLREEAIKDWSEFIQQIRAEAAVDEPSPSRWIWLRLDDSLRKEIGQMSTLKEVEGDVQKVFEYIDQMRRFRTALNKQIADRDFYDADSWADVPIQSQELRLLLDARKEKLEEMSDDEVQRLNRLLVESAYPTLVEASPRTSVRFRYLVMDVGPPLPLRRSSFVDLIERGVRVILNWFFGALGIMIAVVVTAPIIPQTFQPGYLNLLLSKPVARWKLFLAKFVGGCAFVLICAAYLIGGCWLIIGFQFGIWDPRLLLSIPVYLFMFAIYYSVSALAGVVYRNTIICIAASGLFWAACFLVGTGKLGVEQSILNKMRLTQLLETEDSLMAVNEMGLLNRWNDEQREWQTIFESDDQRQMRPAMFLIQSIPTELKPIGPVYDVREKRLISVQRSFRAGNLMVNVGHQENDWEAEAGVTAPSGTMALFREPDGAVIAVSSLGIYRLVGDPRAPKQQATESAGKPGQDRKSDSVLSSMLDAVKRASNLLPRSGLQESPFRSVAPKPLVLTQPADVALDPVSGHFAAYSRGRLAIMRRDAEGNYLQAQQVDLDIDREQPLLLAISGNTVLCAHENGSVELRDARTLDVRKTFEAEPTSQPRFVYASPQGRWLAVVFHNGRLWLADTRSDRFEAPRLRGQGDISAAFFSDDQHLFVADRTARVSQYVLDELDSLELTRRWSPKLGVMETSYRFVLVPMYVVFPKPGELDKTVQYLLSGKSTSADSNTAADLAAARSRLRPWAPVWSSLAFVAVVLTIACVYIERQEF